MTKGTIPEVSDKDLKLMETLLAEGHIAHKFAVRLQAVLNRASGRSTNNVASILGININTVSDHVNRYLQGGLEALLRDKTRKPGIAPIPEEVKDKLIQLVCQEKPKDGTHWSTRELSKGFGISHTAVNTILRERGLKPHLVKKFQFSMDRRFVEKLEDVVGLYLAPQRTQ
jgi:transposase